MLCTLFDVCLLLLSHEVSVEIRNGTTTTPVGTHTPSAVSKAPCVWFRDDNVQQQPAVYSTWYMRILMYFELQSV